MSDGLASLIEAAADATRSIVKPKGLRAWYVASVICLLAALFTYVSPVWDRSHSAAFAFAAVALLLGPSIMPPVVCITLLVTIARGAGGSRPRTEAISNAGKRDAKRLWRVVTALLIGAVVAVNPGSCQRCIDRARDALNLTSRILRGEPPAGTSPPEPTTDEGPTPRRSAAICCEASCLRSRVTAEAPVVGEPTCSSRLRRGQVRTGGGDRRMVATNWFPQSDLHGTQGTRSFRGGGLCWKKRNGTGISAVRREGRLGVQCRAGFIRRRAP